MRAISCPAIACLAIACLAIASVPQLEANNLWSFVLLPTTAFVHPICPPLSGHVLTPIVLVRVTLLISEQVL